MSTEEFLFKSAVALGLALFVWIIIHAVKIIISLIKEEKEFNKNHKFINP